MEAINSLTLLNYAQQPIAAPLAQERGADCCSMVRSQRTAGYIPSYDSFADPTSDEVTALPQDKAFDKLVEEQLVSPDDVYTLTMDEQAIESGTTQEKPERFDVFDFLDMVNPLQHIPVVNYAYRYLTGDVIKPISSIIGGAVFAGPIGAATGLVTAMVERGSGESLPNALLAMTSQKRTDAYEKVAAFADKPLVPDANYDYNT